MNFSDYSFTTKLGAALGIVAAGAAAFYWKFIAAFSVEAYQELLKSTWLPRQQAVSSTLVVIILVLLVAIYAGAIDGALSFLLRAFLGSY